VIRRRRTAPSPLGSWHKDIQEADVDSQFDRPDLEEDNEPAQEEGLILEDQEEEEIQEVQEEGQVLEAWEEDDTQRAQEEGQVLEAWEEDDTQRVQEEGPVLGSQEIDSSEPEEIEVSQESLKASGPRPVPDPATTVIGTGAQLEGKLVTSASLRIEGIAKGQLVAEGDVLVAPEAEVAADIEGINVTLGGHYSGKVNAGRMIELSSTARVEGNLFCRSLIVSQGAVFNGQMTMETDAESAEGELSGTLSIDEQQYHRSSLAL
jgi:cytoskeletal protein CcmA (bactofilin family)